LPGSYDNPRLETLQLDVLHKLDRLLK